MSSSARAALSVILVLVGAALVPFGAAALYAREEIVEPEAFAGAAIESLDRDAVRGAVEAEIAGSLPPQADLPAVRSLVDPALDDALRSAEFRRLFRAAALDTYRRFFVDERDTATLDLGAVGPLLRDELRAVSPRLARAFPRQLDVELVLLRRDELPGGGLLTSDNVRTLGLLLPLLALAALAAALALAPSRARALLGAGWAVMVAGALSAAGVFIASSAVPALLESEGRLTEAELEDAAGALFEVYVSGLYTWALVIAGAGLTLVAVSLIARRGAAT